MKICVVGSGYVGLVGGACFAETGNTVQCVDVDEEKIAKLRDGILPIYEPGLSEIVRANLADKRLSFTTDGPSAVEASDVVFIAVGTPPGEDGSADLSHVLKVAEMIGDSLNAYKVIVVKSTVPVGTCDRVEAAIAARSEVPFDVVSNPEFLKEGAAVDDFLKPDRVIVGTESERARKVMGELYSAFMRRTNRVIFMDRRSSEMTKYASNAMLATKISFINEIARLCDAIGADVEHVRQGMSADARIGPHFIFPGCGYGGSCFPKDIKALVGTAGLVDVDVPVLRSVEEVNGHQKRLLFERLVAHFGGRGALQGKRIAVWGLAFKPRTDDMREAPSQVTIRALVEAGAEVVATDPVALKTAAVALDDVVGRGLTLIEDEYDCLDGADALVIHTEWNVYRNPDFGRIREALKAPVIVDGRNIFKLYKMRELGFTYYGVGRPAVKPDPT